MELGQRGYFHKIVSYWISSISQGNLGQVFYMVPRAFAESEVIIYQPIESFCFMGHMTIGCTHGFLQFTRRWYSTTSIALEYEQTGVTPVLREAAMFKITLPWAFSLGNDHFADTPIGIVLFLCSSVLTHNFCVSALLSSLPCWKSQ